MFAFIKLKFHIQCLLEEKSVWLRKINFNNISLIETFYSVSWNDSIIINSNGAEHLL